MTKEQMINFVNATHPYTFEFLHLSEGYKVYKDKDKILEVKHEPEIDPPKTASGYNLLKNASTARYNLFGVTFFGFTKYNIGDWVKKYSGYDFVGVVRSVYTKTTGEIRYDVEEGKSGMLHIFNEDQLVPFNGKLVYCKACKLYHYAMD